MFVFFDGAACAGKSTIIQKLIAMDPRFVSYHPVYSNNQFKPKLVVLNNRIESMLANNVLHPTDRYMSCLRSLFAEWEKIYQTLLESRTHTNNTGATIYANKVMLVDRSPISTIALQILRVFGPNIIRDPSIKWELAVLANRINSHFLDYKLRSALHVLVTCDDEVILERRGLRGLHPNNSLEGLSISQERDYYSISADRFVDGLFQSGLGTRLVKTDNTCDQQSFEFNQRIEDLHKTIVDFMPSIR